MRRREFIGLLGGTAAWPLIARAQQAERMRHIGLLAHLAADDPQMQTRVGAFLQGLQQSGWAVGRNLRIDFRWAAGNTNNIPKFAAELAALSPEVVLASTSLVVAALQQLQQAYVNYYTSANDYNRAQFRLFRAMGYPAEGLACGNHFGDPIPVDTTRPPLMAPVHAPEPCSDCPR